MRAVEIHLEASDLSKQMAAMRVWLDEHRFESSSFTCRDNDHGVLICVEFRVADQAEAFAKHFGGRANGHTNEELAQKVLETGLPSYGIVG